MNKDNDARIRVNAITGLNFGSKIHIAYVTLQEFTHAVSSLSNSVSGRQCPGRVSAGGVVGLGAWQQGICRCDWQAAGVVHFRGDPGLSVYASARRCGRPVHHVYRRGQSPKSETEGAALSDLSGDPTQVIDNVKRYLSQLQQLAASVQGVLSLHGQEQNVHTIKLSDTGECRCKRHRGPLCVLTGEVEQLV